MSVRFHILQNQGWFPRPAFFFSTMDLPLMEYPGAKKVSSQQLMCFRPETFFSPFWGLYTTYINPMRACARGF